MTPERATAHLPAMPRVVRVAPGKMVFHVLNRGNAKRDIFEDAGDYLAFEKLLTEVLANFSVVLFSYRLVPNYWHLVLRHG